MTTLNCTNRVPDFFSNTLTGMLTVEVTKDVGDVIAVFATVVAATAAVWAVWVAVRESKAANKRTVAAEAREQAAKKDTDDLRAKQERERDDAYAATWADRSAIHVRASATVDGPISQDMHAEFNVKVKNNGDLPIHDVLVQTLPPHNLNTGQPVAEWTSIPAVSDEHSVRKVIYVGQEGEVARNPKFNLLFSDDFGNSWRLAPDGSLFLSKRRMLGIDPESR